MSDIYAEQPKFNSKCSVCGDSGMKRQEKKPKFFKPYYYKVFEKIDWFRGNDEYLGIICKECLKNGKINLTNKERTQTNGR